MIFTSHGDKLSVYSFGASGCCVGVVSGAGAPGCPGWPGAGAWTGVVSCGCSISEEDVLGCW